ncbi:hypothetical protein BN1013_00044 [Candidatus Rubidus massiliensis]|nr:MAG: hypothetical protein BGO10_03130 [Chlamydia sp. 32-24]CDZ79550.1 hypothetical protein BN1013_00044 [Candidatus Rubidus massiliensis]
MEKNFTFSFKAITCIFTISILLYFYINRLNDITELKLSIPQLNKELKSIQEENNRLRYEIEQFESPVHLMELHRKPEFSHLKYPYENEIIQLPQILAQEK